MPRTIGIVGGLGPEGTVHYYRKLVELLAAIPLEEERPGLAVAHVWIDRFASLLRRGEEDEIVALLGGALERLHRAGADVALVAAVTPHKFLDRLRKDSPVPIVDLVEATRRALVSARFRTVGLLGTRTTLTDRFFKGPLEEAGLRVVVPEDGGVAYLDALIFGPLASGEKTAPMRERVTEIVDGMASRAPLDAIVVACTDLMELVATTLPVVDPIDCHVRLAAESMTRAPRPSSARS
jgi:aspartate racemase